MVREAGFSGSLLSSELKYISGKWLLMKRTTKATTGISVGGQKLKGLEVLPTSQRDTRRS